MAQSIGPELKPQYCEEEGRRKRRKRKRKRKRKKTTLKPLSESPILSSTTKLLNNCLQSGDHKEKGY
jgi:hypothetical protein